MKVVKAFLLFFLIYNTGFAKQANIVNIRLNTINNNERIVFDLDSKATFNAFTLTNPNRLVIDFGSTNQNITAPDVKTDKIIDSIRVGKFSDTDTRLVFDLNAKSKILKSFYLQPSQDNKNHRIVIDFEFSKQDLENEDLIGKLIDENNLYGVEPEILNEIINEILSKPIEVAKTNTPKISLPTSKTTQTTNIRKKQETMYNISSSQTRKPRIIIDAGHGGKDPGAIGRKNTKEKILTLIYAKSLKEALDKTGKYKVYLTRSQDYYVDLRERTSMARRYKGDLFISIHADSALNKNARGLSIYTLSQIASDTRTAQVAQKENKADIIGGLNLYGEYQDTINTLVDISRQQSMNDSKKFAKILERELFNRNIKGLGEMKKFGNFAVLTSADMPSILLEIGFLSNKTDERMIRSFGYKTKIINSLLASIDKYFN
ncbi:MAG: N-acetylmuramoyl-L-alanine amidase [Rickettsiales bacterium]|nr:N-acetylmuramoyl-L-alanine amidase [Rickettsiales bacterium]